MRTSGQLPVGTDYSNFNNNKSNPIYLADTDTVNI